jgi:branched-subunit amino acid aminotransferase/4-amino-4-deoxychorismate lyase
MADPYLVNGVASEGRIPLTDSSVLRGDGCFEVIRTYGAEPFALDAHLKRLERSAGLLDISIAPATEIAGWVRAVAAHHRNSLVRILVTRGAAAPGEETGTLVIVFGHPLPPVQPAARLAPVAAPWHPAGEAWELSGAKTLSYAPNLAASRAAKASGFDDALLISRAGHILEGPTFSVAWVIDEKLETPGLELGILDSITRATALEISKRSGIDCVTGSWGVDRLKRASEVMALSTVREVQPVTAVGDFAFAPGAVAGLLNEQYGYLSGPAD